MPRLPESINQLLHQMEHATALFATQRERYVLACANGRQDDEAKKQAIERAYADETVQRLRAEIATYIAIQRPPELPKDVLDAVNELDICARQRGEIDAAPVSFHSDAERASSIKRNHIAACNGIVSVLLHHICAPTDDDADAEPAPRVTDMSMFDVKAKCAICTNEDDEIHEPSGLCRACFSQVCAEQRDLGVAVDGIIGPATETARMKRVADQERMAKLNDMSAFDVPE